MRGAIDKEYYEELNKPKQGYNGVTPKVFLEHMFTEYREKNGRDANQDAYQPTRSF